MFHPASLFVATVLLAIGGCAAVAHVTGTPSTPVAPELDRNNAIIGCRVEVERGLVAPSSVKFVSERVTLDQATNVWTVNMAIDAQNTFGATVRGNYVCKATLNPKPPYSTVLSLTGGGPGRL